VSGQVTVLFFASLRDELGLGELCVEAADSAELMTVLAARLPPEAMAALGQDNVRMAVNQQLIEGTVALNRGDEVAFLPPVTGG